MLNFRKIVPEDRDVIHNNLSAAVNHGCEYSFVNLFCWADQRVAFFGATPVFFCRYGNWTCYLVPQCENIKEAVDALLADARERHVRFRIYGASPDDARMLQALYPDRFNARSVRDGYDYIYDVERLCGLRGRKLQAKRNHCNHFEQTYPDYRVLPLTRELLPRCIEFTRRWHEEHLDTHPYSDMSEEEAAIQKVFQHFDALRMEGVALETADGIVAFSMGNRIREDTFDVNFEKARAEINGAYPMVNREFARLIHSRYPEVKYLNREDDMGIEGLRRAKESYYPDLLLEKVVLEERR